MQQANLKAPTSLAARALHFPLTRIALALSVVVATLPLSRFLTRALGRSVDGTPWYALLSFAFTTALAYAGYAAYVRVVERRALSELDRRAAGRELLAGVALGIVLVGATVGVLALLGMYHVTASHQWRALLVPLIGAATAASIEELVARGILFRIGEESLGTWAALVGSAAIFGLLHLGNDHATLLGAFAIAVEAGIPLGAGYVLTRRLWLPIGLHFGWNFAEGGLFGVAVSGHHSSGQVSATLTGPAWLSGGVFGIEDSVVAVIFCLVAGVALLLLAARRRQFVGPMWRPRGPRVPTDNAPIVNVAPASGSR